MAAHPGRRHALAGDARSVDTDDLGGWLSRLASSTNPLVSAAGAAALESLMEVVTRRRARRCGTQVVAEHPRALRRWLQVAALLAPLGLGGCLFNAGSADNPTGTTHVSVGQFGPLQGLTIADGKDRQSVLAQYESSSSQGCGIPGRPDLCKKSASKVSIETRDSNGSVAQAAAMQAQAETTGKALDVIGGLVSAGAAVAPIPVPRP